MKTFADLTPEEQEAKIQEVKDLVKKHDMKKTKIKKMKAITLLTAAGKVQVRTGIVVVGN